MMFKELKMAEALFGKEEDKMAKNVLENLAGKEVSLLESEEDNLDIRGVITKKGNKKPEYYLVNEEHRILIKIMGVKKIDNKSYVVDSSFNKYEVKE